MEATDHHLWWWTQLGASCCKPLPTSFKNFRDWFGKLIVEHVRDALSQDFSVHIVVVVQHIQCLQVLPSMAGRLGRIMFSYQKEKSKSPKAIPLVQELWGCPSSSPSRCSSTRCPSSSSSCPHCPPRSCSCPPSAARTGSRHSPPAAAIQIHCEKDWRTWCLKSSSICKWSRSSRWDVKEDGAVQQFCLQIIMSLGWAGHLQKGWRVQLLCLKIIDVHKTCLHLFANNWCHQDGLASWKKNGRYNNCFFANDQGHLLLKGFFL